MFEDLGSTAYNRICSSTHRSRPTTSAGAGTPRSVASMVPGPARGGRHALPGVGRPPDRAPRSSLPVTGWRKRVPTPNVRSRSRALARDPQVLGPSLCDAVVCAGRRGPHTRGDRRLRGAARDRRAGYCRKHRSAVVRVASSSTSTASEKLRRSSAARLPAGPRSLARFWPATRRPLRTCSTRSGTGPQRRTRGFAPAVTTSSGHSRSTARSARPATSAKPNHSSRRRGRDSGLVRLPA